MLLPALPYEGYELHYFRFVFHSVLATSFLSTEPFCVYVIALLPVRILYL